MWQEYWQRFVDWVLLLWQELRTVPAPAPAGVEPDMPKPTIAVINSSSVVSDADAANVITALQIQVSNHFAPAWGVDATLVSVKKGQIPPAGSWWLVILDNSDQAGALGYHDVTAEGLPMGKVFAGTDKQYGNLWSVTASHELLEMLGDPSINRCAQSNDGNFYAFENCDAVEADELGYFVGGQVKVSDFVLPPWFGNLGDSKMDYCGHLTEPFQLAAGGYISVWTPQSGWSMVTADKATHKTLFGLRAPVGSRRERRHTPKYQWLHSTAHRRPDLRSA